MHTLTLMNITEEQNQALSQNFSFKKSKMSLMAYVRGVF
ncbi:hypothetical protein X560_0358 [Listeria fleischmannii 1991]|uniref:Uncharacterized protein n=1 Tax=Listeria fleischmannii 1991 TaxID=1430899 RepID=A0A0J8GJL3_9LIST|nr:hypothetical protein X560_0358 [Listeria fleischmannii 1991]